MESRLIPAVVLVPALIWPACNGGTENLGDGDGGSAGAELTSTTTGDNTQGSGDSGVSGAGGNSTAVTTGSAGPGSGGNGNTDGSLPDSGPIGGFTSASTNTGIGGDFGAGGWTSTAVTTGAGGNVGAGGGWTSASTNTGIGGGFGAGGGLGAGGGTFYGATRIHQSSQVIPMLAHDTEQIYTGGSNLAGVTLPDGPGTILNTATYGTTVAVDGTHLYVCSPGSLYRMSKAGGGTQNFQGSGVDATYGCTAVAVDETTVSAAWFNPESNALRVRRWAKSDRTAPEDGLELDELGDAYAPALIANNALYYADRTSDELLIGRILLDDYAEEPVLNVDAEFDSEYVEPLAANSSVLYYQSCEQVDRWCSLFSLPSDEDEPIPFEMYQRDNVIAAAAPLGAGVVVALYNGVFGLTSAAAELTAFWTHPGMLAYGPLLILDGQLYFVANPEYGAGSTLWRLPVADD
ncbi:MAG TPA: hypothetical protein VI197_20035 [Polyangiaceae bacterium]